MSKRDLFWCDHCAKKGVDSNGNDTVNWYGCYTSQHYSKHKKTKKHIASVAKDEREEISITRNKCNEKFSEEGFANHEKRNKTPEGTLGTHHPQPTSVAGQCGSRAPPHTCS